MSRYLQISGYGDTLQLTINTGKRRTRILLTADQAQHVSNRMQSYAKGNMGVEIVAVEGEE